MTKDSNESITVTYTEGIKEWRFNGKRHRLDGPAVEYADGDKEWWFNGKLVTGEEHKKLTF